MTIIDLEREQLTILPQRLETIILHCAPLTTTHPAAQQASQTSNISQSNINLQSGGNCIGANCAQTNVQTNVANVNQQIAQVNRYGTKFDTYFRGDWWRCGY